MINYHWAKMYCKRRRLNGTASLSEDHKRKISNVHRGKPKSEETKRKMSEARKKYWTRKKLLNED